MKNVYAMALGISDGMAELGGQPWHELKAAAFVQAVREMLLLSKLVGGEPFTAVRCTGVGDPDVMGVSCGNSFYGMRSGRGEPAKQQACR